MVVKLPRAAVLLAGIGFLPTQLGGISLSPTGPRLAPHYGDYTPTGQQLEPSLWFGPSSTLSGLPGGGLGGLAQEQGSDGIIAGTVTAAMLQTANGAVAAAGATGLVPSVTAAPFQPGTGYGCGQLPGQLQSGGQYWNTRTSGRLPALLAANVPGDPVEGPAGDPSNLPPDGRGGGWCRPRPLPFADSSPLASRAFWVPVAVLLVGASLFWLSRGVSLPPDPS